MNTDSKNNKTKQCTIPFVRRSAYKKLTAEEKKIFDAVMRSFPATSFESALDVAWQGGVKFDFIPT